MTAFLAKAEPPIGDAAAVGRPWSRLEIALLAATVAIACWLRFARLDLCEFKGDELKMLLETLRALETGRWPAAGMPASIGVDVGPTLYYLIAPPLLLGPSPVVVSGWIALLGTLAIVALYAALRPRFGPFVALGATVLAATAPWMVLYSRKIWAPDVLLIFAVPLLHCLFAVVERRRTWWVFPVPLLAVTLAQLHLSAIPVAATATIVLCWRWRAIDRRAFGLGLVLALATVAPYALHEARSGWVDLRLLRHAVYDTGGVPHDPIGSVAVRVVSRTLDAASAGGWDFVTGASTAAWEASAWPIPELARVARCLLAIAILGGLASTIVQLASRIAAGARRRRLRLRRGERSRLVLALWLVAVWLFFVVLRLHHLHRHYFVVTQPMSSAFAALALDDLRRVARGRSRRIATGVVAALVALIAVVHCAFTLAFFRFIADYGGTAGDYGVAFAAKRAVARHALCHGLQVVPEDGAREIPFLVTLEREHGGARAYCGTEEPAPAGVLVVRSRLHDARPLSCPAAAVRRFGPLDGCVFGRGGALPNVIAVPPR